VWEDEEVWSCTWAMVLRRLEEWVLLVSTSWAAAASNWWRVCLPPGMFSSELRGTLMPLRETAGAKVVGRLLAGEKKVVPGWRAATAASAMAFAASWSGVVLVDGRAEPRATRPGV
jgi:hypothetical protein